MKSLRIKYTSVWDQDIEVTSPATLDLTTGQITNIGKNDIDQNTEFQLSTLDKEFITIKELDRTFDLEEDLDTPQVDKEQLAEINHALNNQL